MSLCLSHMPSLVKFLFAISWYGITFLFSIIGSSTSCNFCKSNIFCVKLRCGFKQQGRINCMAQVRAMIWFGKSFFKFCKSFIEFNKAR